MIRTLAMAACMLGPSAVTQAAQVMELTETFRIQRFDDSHTRFGSQVAIDGEWVLVRAERLYADRAYASKAKRR